MCKAFVKLPRPFGDQSGGARKWAFRDGCQTWWRDGVFHAPAAPANSHANKPKGGKSRATGRSKELAIGSTTDLAYDALSPGLNTAHGPSTGPAWDPVRNPLPWLHRSQAAQQGQVQQQSHSQEQQLVPRIQPQLQGGGMQHGLVAQQYGQSQGYSNMPPAYAYQQHSYGGGGGGGGGAWASSGYQHPGQHYSSPPEYANNWRPQMNNFGFNEPPSFERHRDTMSVDDDSNSNAQSNGHPHSRPSPGPEGEYQLGEGDYPKRETSTPLSSPPPGPGSSDT